MSEQEEQPEEEEIDVHQFVDEYIKRDYAQKVIESFSVLEDETEMWLEVNDQEFGEVSHDQYICSECNNHIGDDDSDVFEHIRNAHPTVTGLRDKEPSEDDEYEDEEEQVLPSMHQE